MPVSNDGPVPKVSYAMNVYYAEDGSYYDIVYDGKCIRRFHRKNDLVCSFILTHKIGFWWRTSLPIITLAHIILNDPEDEHEYVRAKFMFAPNPAFFLPYFVFVCFLFHLATVYPLENIEFYVLFPLIAISLLVSYLMTRSYREYVTNGFSSSTELKTLPCSFWRVATIYLLSMFALLGPAITLMQEATLPRVGNPKTS